MRSKGLPSLAVAGLLLILLGLVAMTATAAGQPLGKHRCRGVDSGSYRNLFVASGDSCTFSGSTRDIKVEPGSTLTLSGAHVSHDLHANQASAVTVNLGTRIDHDASVAATVGAVSITGSSIGHDAHFEHNTSLLVGGNNIGHDLKLDQNANAQLSATNVGHDGHCGGTVMGAGNSYKHHNKGCPA